MKRAIFSAGLVWLAFCALPVMGQGERAQAEREAAEAAHAAAQEAHAAAEQAHADASRAAELSELEAQSAGQHEESQALLVELQALQQFENDQRAKMHAIRERLASVHAHHSLDAADIHDAARQLLESRLAAHEGLGRVTQGLTDGMNLIASRLEQLERLANQADWATQESRSSLHDAMQSMESAAGNLMRALEQLHAEVPADDSHGDSAGHSGALARELLSGQNTAGDGAPARQALAELWALQANQSALADEARIRALDLDAEHAAAAAHAAAEQARQQAEDAATHGDRFQQLENRLERIEKALERLARDRSPGDDDRP
jgi:hypothetical protein